MKLLKLSAMIFCFYLSTTNSVLAREPERILDYNPAVDSVCALVRGYTIKQEWQAELVERKQEFENLWREQGPEMIAAAERITHKTFPQDNVDVRLTLCDFPSSSFFGVTINMRYALRSFTDTPVPMSYKTNTLFHELLHHFLNEYPIQRSALLDQHSSETSRVLDHLHLFALQKAVLLELNEVEMLKQQIAIDSQLPGGHYKRAWEIINRSDEEYLKYIAEIRTSGEGHLYVNR